MSNSRGYATSQPTYIKKDLGNPLKHFSPAASGASEPVKIKDVQAVASYSWIDAKAPTIAVPGSPNIWTNSNPKRVPADSGVVFIDQNAHRMGPTASPLTPIFAAIDDFHGNEYDFSGIDIVSDRNNLRKLFRWATGVADEKDFRIDIDLAGQTCLFTRREEKNAETVLGFKGFGHEYEKAATRLAPGCERTTGHHRIISINFGGLKVLLRFEVDACTGVADSDPDDLAAAFSGLGLKPSASAVATDKTTRTAIPGISIIPTTPRKLAAQSSLIEMKTRASHRPLDWAEAYPQLYLSQTTYLYLAQHNRGNFSHVEKVSLAGDTMKVYAKQAEAGMGKLKSVLDEVLDVARQKGHGVGLSLVCEKGRLTLYKRKQGTGKVAAKEIVDKFL